MLNIKNSLSSKRRAEDSCCKQARPHPKKHLSKLLPLTSVRNLPSKKKRWLHKMTQSCFFAAACTGAASHQQERKELASESRSKMPHSGITKPVTGFDWFLLKLLVHISLFTSPESITNLVGVFFEAALAHLMPVHPGREHITKPLLLGERFHPF